MTASRDVVHTHGDTELRALLLPADAPSAGTVLLVHDAFGLGGFSLDVAHRLRAAGYTVFAVDMWGERATPGPAEIGPLIGGMVADRPGWTDRIAAAHAAACAQPEVDPTRVAALGFCFGGSTVLELVRAGATLRAAVAVHAGLDLLDPAEPWAPAATPRVLVCTGGEDPMATPTQWRALRGNLDRAGIDWELNLYGGAVHAFTNPALADSPRPDVTAYHPQSARRAWASTLDLLAEVLAP